MLYLLTAVLFFLSAQAQNLAYPKECNYVNYNGIEYPVNTCQSPNATNYASTMFYCNGSTLYQTLYNGNGCTRVQATAQTTGYAYNCAGNSSCAGVTILLKNCTKPTHTSSFTLVVNECLKESGKKSKKRTCTNSALTTTYYSNSSTCVGTSTSVVQHLGCNSTTGLNWTAIQCTPTPKKKSSIKNIPLLIINGLVALLALKNLL